MAKAASDRPIAAIKAVTVVPTFAPIIKGNNFFGEILFVAASRTLNEVITEDEWMAAENPIPEKSDNKELSNAEENHFLLVPSNTKYLKTEASV